MATSGWNIANRLRTFSLRTALVVFLLLSAGLGLCGRWVQEIRRRGDSQRRIIALCSEKSRQASFHRAPEPGTNWFTSLMRAYIHPEYGKTCSKLEITGEMLEDPSVVADLHSLFQVDHLEADGYYKPEAFAAIFNVPGLKRLSVSGPVCFENDSSDWSSVQAARELETVDFGERYLSDSLARELAKLPNLKNIYQVHCSAEALVSLAELPNLTELSVAGGHWRYVIENEQAMLPEEAERVYLHGQAAKLFALLAQCEKLKRLTLHYTLYLQPEDIAEFCRQSPVVELTLTDVSMNPECLAQIARLSKLKNLTIREYAIEDRHLDALAGASQFESIKITGETTFAADEELRRKLPNCLVNGRRGPQFPKESASASLHSAGR